MSKLICPCCQQSTLTWLTDMEDPSLLDWGIMQCNNRWCDVMYQGIPGWRDRKLYHPPMHVRIGG